MNMLIFLKDFLDWSEKKIKLSDLLFSSPIPALTLLMLFGPLALLVFGRIHIHELLPMYLSVVEALTIAFGICLINLLFIFTLVKMSKQK